MSNEEKKAKELIEKFYPHSGDVDAGDNSSAKQCALLCVEEIINDYKTLWTDADNFEYKENKISFWQQVKQQIQNHE